MSITKVQPSKDVAAAAVYVLHETRQNMRSGVVRAERLAIISSDPTVNDALSFAAAARSQLAGAKRSRKDEAICIIQSWSPEELDANDPTDLDLAFYGATQLLNRVAPNSDGMVAIHTDGKGGQVHAHIVIVNHDDATGNRIEKARNWHAVKAENDALMTELGMRVITRDPVSLSKAEVNAQKEGRRTSADGLTLDEVDRDTWRDYARARIEEMVADERVVSAPTDSGALDAMQEVAGDYGLSFRRRPGKTKKNGKRTADSCSFALVNDDGSTHTYDTSRGTRTCACTGKSLGTDYDISGLLAAVALHRLQLGINRITTQQQNLERKIKNGAEHTPVDGVRTGSDTENLEGDQPYPTGLGAVLGNAGDEGNDSGNAGTSIDYGELDARLGEVGLAVERFGQVEGRYSGASAEPGQGGTGSAAGRADRSGNAGAHRRGKPSPHERSREPEDAVAEHGSAARGRGRDGGGTTESQRRRRSQAERQRREAAQRAAERTAAHTVEGAGGFEF